MAHQKPVLPLVTFLAGSDWLKGFLSKVVAAHGENPATAALSSWFRKIFLERGHCSRLLAEKPLVIRAWSLKVHSQTSQQMLHPDCEMVPREIKEINICNNIVLPCGIDSAHSLMLTKPVQTEPCWGEPPLTSPLCGSSPTPSVPRRPWSSSTASSWQAVP